MACGAKSPSGPSGNPPAAITSLQIVSSQARADVGTPITLSANAVAADGTTYTFTSGLTWTTSNNAVLDVQSNGVMMPVSAGDATITLAWGSLTATRTFSVEQTRSGVFVWGKVSEYSSGLAVGGQEILIDGSPAATTDVRGNYGAWLDGPGTATVRFSPTEFVGSLIVAPRLRADLLKDSRNCSARYGRVVDAASLAPLPGVTVSILSRSSTTDAQGNYRLDLTCPTPDGGNTTFLQADLAGYQRGFISVGRGVPGVNRLDVALTRQ
jgi:hypothetical protein